MFGILNGMQGEGGTALSKLAAAVREFRARDERVDLKELRGVIDELEGEFSLEARLAQKTGDHLIGGDITPASLIARSFGISMNSAAQTHLLEMQLHDLVQIPPDFGA